MKLVIKGFKKQNIISIDDVVNILKSVPKPHKAGITTIVYDPERFYKRSYVAPQPINYSALGEYSNLPIDHILIYEFASLNQFRHMLLHEIGHHVFRRILTSSERKKWVTELYPVEGNVTRYAQTNANEDFAESYACFYTNPLELKKLNKKFLYIKQLF
ncbi:hypothetical protein KIH87_12890 [Paraneptunicella aestuarii]|uniref:hypothetical protein n=1 Tax=Paraneptunicella aestuarii TaxID=2831148 RepID=UPI001E446F05|nr:hypothetical protein [Paraneptunicella aestuarii]UAA37606.1 hypothetical protein KIH87_12890 [Paraneptunicella aestuarii]